ncbi:MAG: CTP synthase [Tissierellia bacterium]|nr:CTP synthase [Tissierellia bacterium]
MATKYIFVTGGVVSSLGKGITAASLGRLLKSRGLKVTIQKFDPYINVDPGSLSPYQHGEVYVTEDGGETDLDLGHYERFIDINLTKNNSITTGKVYWSVLNKERSGEYDGKTVQVIPHITNEIKERIMKSAKERELDVLITEIGGTVGDIESLPFLEAIRQLRYDVGRENIMYIHVTLVPYLSKAGELKTKPTQHSVKELRSLGIQPDLLICRAEKHLAEELKRKIALFCDLEPSEVIENLDASTIYELPQMLEEQGLSMKVIEHLNLECNDLDLREWNSIVDKVNNPMGKVKVALVGKYVELKDAYLSVAESLSHAGIANNVEVEIDWVHSEDLDLDTCHDALADVDGIIVPDGFGRRGIEGKICAIQYARENNIPYLGISLGMQLAAVEFARNVLGLKDAHTTEVDENTPYPIIDLMSDQTDVQNIGGTLRLGAHPCKLKEATKAMELYNDQVIYERHRHRYGFNNEFREKMEQNGMIVSGVTPDDSLVEMVELKDHPWFIGVQFRPEFKSRPTKAHPLFKGFIAASIKNRD